MVVHPRSIWLGLTPVSNLIGSYPRSSWVKFWVDLTPGVSPALLIVSHWLTPSHLHLKRFLCLSTSQGGIWMHGGTAPIHYGNVLQRMATYVNLCHYPSWSSSSWLTPAAVRRVGNQSVTCTKSSNTTLESLCQLVLVKILSNNDGNGDWYPVLLRRG